MVTDMLLRDLLGSARHLHIFISHSWSYGDAYDRLIDLLRAEPTFHFVDHSVPRDDPIHFASSEQALAQAIHGKMAPCDVVLIMAGVYATYSRWIGHEIQISKRWFVPPKPLVAIRPWGNERISTIVQNSADRLVGWNTKSIVSAVRGVT